MKNSHVFRSISCLIFAGLLAPTSVILGQKQWLKDTAAKAQSTYKAAKTGALEKFTDAQTAAQRTLAEARKKGKAAVESAKQKFAASKQRAAKLTQDEINKITLGIKAAQKKLRGQPLTEAELTAMGSLAKYSAAVIALVAIAAGIGAGVYLGTRKEETELPPTPPATYEEKLLAHIKIGLTQGEKDLIQQMYTLRDEPWYKGIQISQKVFDAAQAAPLVEFKEKSFSELAEEELRGPVPKTPYRYPSP